MSTPRLKAELQRADLRLKRVERWVQLAAGIAAIATVTSTGFGIYVAYSQHRLLSAQALEAQEKQRVSFTFRLTPVMLPDNTSFYVRAKLRNLSVRQLTVLMLGVRVWQGDKWTDAAPVEGHQKDLILSDILVNDCTNLCTPQSATGPLRLRELEDITIEPTEPEIEETFGPYPLKKEDLDQGFWLTGRAYVAETESANCQIDARRPPKPGVLPFLDGSRCSAAVAPAEYYTAKNVPRAGS